MNHFRWEAVVAGPIQSFPYSWLMVPESRHIYVGVLYGHSEYAYCLFICESQSMFTVASFISFSLIRTVTIEPLSTQYGFFQVTIWMLTS